MKTLRDILSLLIPLRILTIIRAGIIVYTYAVTHSITISFANPMEYLALAIKDGTLLKNVFSTYLFPFLAAALALGLFTWLYALDQKPGFFKRLFRLPLSVIVASAAALLVVFLFWEITLNSAIICVQVGLATNLLFILCGLIHRTLGRLRKKKDKAKA